MAEENVGVIEPENYLGDWKDKDTATVGLKNLQGIMAKKGDEVGDLRKQVSQQLDTIEILKQQNVPAAQQQSPDLQAELKAVQSEMMKLDTVDVEYNQNLNSLIQQQGTLVAEIQHQKTLAESTVAFKNELNKRDEAAAHKAFFNANPEFNTSEMQNLMQQRIADDPTGMTDHLVAFREIQRDQAMLKATEMAEENKKLTELAKLKGGTDSIGKVYTGSGQTPQKNVKVTQTTAERDAAMLEAVRNAA